MTIPLRLLMLEDNPSDAELVLHALRRAGYEPSVARVETEADYRDHLKDAPEIILADFTMPEFDSLRALEILREARLNVPFIIVSGTIGEERAVQVMQRGATDYVMKDRLGRLGQAVTSALERTGADRRLQAVESRIQELTANIQQVLWTVDVKDARILYVSPAYETLWGRSCESLLAAPQSFMEGIHPLDHERVRCERVGVMQTGTVDIEFRVVRPDTSVRWVRVRGYPIHEDRLVVRIVGMVEDITERRRLAEERDALVLRLQQHIQRLPLGYILCDAEGRVVDWNPMAERIFGFPRGEMLGVKPPYEGLFPPALWERWTEICTRVRGGDMEAHSVNENLTKDGRTITCEWFNTPLTDDSGVFLGFLSLVRDITEQRLLEEQFRQSQKMEAFGQLAGGIAHDFNNLLSIITGYSDLLMRRLPSGDPSLEPLGEIKSAGERSAALTRQLLAFSRKQMLSMKTIDLNDVVRELEAMLRRVIGEDVNLVTRLQPGLRTMRGDSGQLGQVLLNLVVNARDAMPQGGTLTIATGALAAPASTRARVPVAQADAFLFLSVTDTGVGMSEEVQAHLFEPFFTTKPKGQGTGLGLAVVHGIVRQSGGHVEVESTMGHGSRFMIVFPHVDGATAVEPLVPTLPAVLGGSETILLIEDEPALRGYLRHVLVESGYAVLEAGNGEEALRTVKAHTGAIHMTITDVVMPGAGGAAVVAAVQSLRPNMKVLYMSGYTEDAVLRQGICQEKVEFLQKPFSPVALAQKVAAVLGRRPLGRDGVEASTASRVRERPEVDGRVVIG